MLHSVEIRLVIKTKPKFLQVFNSLVDKNIPSSCLPCFLLFVFFQVVLFVFLRSIVFGKSEGMLRT